MSETKSGKQILVVEDPGPFREELCLALQHEGHHVFEASESKGAKDVYDTQNIDLMIVEIALSDGNGLAIILDLTTRHPDVGVVAVTGGIAAIEATDILRTSKRLGALATFVKPVAVVDLVASVRNLLSRPDITGA